MKFYKSSFLKEKYIENGIWLYLLQAFNTILPLITVPYITRILGTVGYGTFSISLNIISYLQVVIEYGFGMSATREVTLSDQNQDFLNRIYTGVFFSRIFLLLVCVLPSAIYLFIKRTDVELCTCFCVLLLSLIGYVIQLNWLFQGKQEMKYISIASISARLITVVLIITIVKKKHDLIIYSLLYASAPIISGIIGQIIARLKYKVRLIKISITDIRNELLNGWYVFTTQLSSKVFGAIGVTFLGLFATKEEAGIYSAILKIPTLLILAWSPISQIIYPMISKRMGTSFFCGVDFVRKIKRYVLVIFGVACLLCSVFSYSIIRIAFGIDYVVKSYWVIPLLIWVLVSIINNFNGIQILLGSGHDIEYSKCFQIGVCVTVIVNYVLVYFLGGDGACLAPVISEAFLGVLLYYQVKKITKCELNN